MQRRWRRVPGVAVVLSIATHITAQAPALLAPNGPATAGYMRFTMPLATATPKARSTRTLFLECWYPAEGGNGLLSTKRYTTPAVEAAFGEQLGLAKNWGETIKTYAIEDAVPESGRHPVIVLSHGLSWPISIYQALAEDLASRGFVVVGVNHPGGTVIDYGHGEVKDLDPMPEFANDSSRNAHLARLTAVWTADLRAVLGMLRSDGPGSPIGALSQRIDPERIALVGHSLGGSASAPLSGAPGVKAVVLLEGLLRDTVATSLTMKAPLLHMIGEYNRMELETHAYLPSPDAPVYQAVVAGTGHAYFSDLICIYKSTAPPDWLERHRYELEPQRIIQITRDYVAAFLGRYLLGEDHVLLHPVSYSAKVDGPSSAGYPEVELTINY